MALNAKTKTKKWLKIHEYVWKTALNTKMEDENVTQKA